MKLQELFEKIALGPEIDPENFKATCDHFISERLLNSETLQRAFKITNKEMEELYEEAYLAYQKEEYEKASLFFRYLAIFNPFEKRFWMGCGATFQLQEKFEEALKPYAMAALLDTKDPYPHFHAYECYASLNNMTEAFIALEDARVRASKQNLYSELRQEIEVLQRGKKYA